VSKEGRITGAFARDFDRTQHAATFSGLRRFSSLKCCLPRPRLGEGGSIFIMRKCKIVPGENFNRRRRSPRTLTPWIEQRYSEAFYVFHVPGDEGQPVHEGGRRQQTVFRRNRPQSTQPPPLLGDFQCDRQDALGI